MPIKIDLMPGWRLTSDKYQYIIQRCSGTSVSASDDKEFDWKSESYHPSIENAVKHLHKQAVREADARTLAEVLENSERILSALSDGLTPHYKVVSDE